MTIILAIIQAISKENFGNLYMGTFVLDVTISLAIILK